MIKTLLADDNPIICESLSRTIHWNELGCIEPICVHDGDAARIEIQDQEPGIIISDIRMPGMDGLDLLCWTKHNYPRISFIIITGFDQFDYARRALREGAFDLILKPISNREIMNSLKRAVHAIRQNTRNNTHRKNLERKVNTLIPDARVKYFRDIILTPDDFMPHFDERSIPVSKKGIFRLFAYAGEAHMRHQRSALVQFSVKMKTLYALDVEIFPLEQRYYAVVYAKERERFESIPLNNTPGNDENIIASDIYGSWFDLKTAFREIQGYLTEQREEKSEENHPRKGERFSPQVRLIIDTLTESMIEKITLTDLASRLRLSGAHISRVLKKETGMTFVDIFARIRISRSIELLRTGRFRVNEAGREVGFENYAYFYQIFRKHTGYSPREYPFSEDPFSIFRLTSGDTSQNL